MKWLTLILAASLTGCVSTHMKRYIGQDVRYIILDDGEPVGAMDMPDGTRAFQYRWGGGKVAVPARTTTTGQIQLVGNSAYYQEQKLQTGGFVAEVPGCLVSYFARWNPEKKGWIVESIRYPKKLVC